MKTKAPDYETRQRRRLAAVKALLALMNAPDPTWILGPRQTIFKLIEHWEGILRDHDHRSGMWRAQVRELYWISEEDFSERDRPLLKIGAKVEHVEALVDEAGHRTHLWAYRVLPPRAALLRDTEPAPPPDDAPQTQRERGLEP